MTDQNPDPVDTSPTDEAGQTDPPRDQPAEEDPLERLLGESSTTTSTAESNAPPGGAELEPETVSDEGDEEVEATLDPETVEETEDDQPDFVDVHPFFWPSTITDNRTDADEILAATNPSVVWALPPYVGAGIFFLLGAFLTVVHLTGQTGTLLSALVPVFTIGAPSWWGLLLLLCFLTAGAFAATAYIRRRLIWYVVTPDQLFVREGILIEHISDIETKDITEIEATQPALLKHFDVGYVKIGTATTDDWALTLQLVPRPNQIRDTIRQTVPDDPPQEDQPDYSAGR